MSDAVWVSPSTQAVPPVPSGTEGQESELFTMRTFPPSASSAETWPTMLRLAMVIHLAKPCTPLSTLVEPTFTVPPG